MRRIFIIALLAMFSLGAYAQNYEKSLGLRLGKPVGLTYKQFVSTNNAFEVIVDLDFFEKDVFKIGGSGFYLWEWNLGDVQGLDWFVGPGVSAGVFVVNAGGNTASDFNVSLDGLIGLEYKFANIPLALAVDFGPRFYFLNDAGIYWGGALSVRYTF